MSPTDDNTIRRDLKDLLTQSGVLKANLVVLTGEDMGRRFEISKSTMIVGRGEHCDITIDDQDVSREHAKIELRKDGIFIEDLGSTNGTLVNGVRVQEHPLVDGDRIQVGNVTILKFNFVDDIEDTFTEQLYNAANKDFLTQIYNRKYFWDRLKSEFSYADRHESPLSLIVFDIDHFKQVNDLFGHAAGDFILRALAEQISSIKREEDLFARFGGEEFVLLLRGTALERATQIAEKLRQKVEEHQFHFEGKEIPITISAGVSSMETENFKDYESFFRDADKKLYQAKHEGRNRIIVSGSKPS